MSYMQKVLQPGEVIRGRFYRHWVLYLPACGIAAMGALALGLVPLSGGGTTVGLLLFAIVAFVIAIIRAVRAFFERWTTEYVITNKRVLAVRGLISRRTVEMNASKIETVDVAQNALGRLLNYGDVILRGTGSTWEPMRAVDSPLALRNLISAN